MFILSKIVFSPSACTWLHDYQSDWQQSVNMGTVHSDFLSAITKGVPKGSILGPLLFTIYIKIIIPCLINCHLHLYVDDAILYCIADSAERGLDNMQHSLNILQAAFVLKLVLNAHKTKFMLFSRSKDPSFREFQNTNIFVFG